MRIKRPATPLSSKLVLWFAFLGPLGNLIPLPGAPASVRFFYLMLPPGILIYLWKGIRRRTFNHILILVPVLAYMLCSAVYAQVRYSDEYGGSEENPVVRFALFIVLLLFTMCAGDETLSFSLHQKLRVLGAFMSGYLVSLVIGYVFFIGFYARLFTLDFISRFEILVQWGFGLLRFSPGSYPNEYGVVSSFALSVLTLLLVYRRQLIGSDPIFRRISSTPLLLLSFLLTLGALFLATTRAAYVSYVVSVLYIGLSQGGFKKPMIFLARTAIAAFVLLLCVQPFFDVESVLAGGYHAFFDQTSFASGRLGDWDIALGLYLRQPYLGFGFGTMDMMHNVYLQMLFGLGIVGFSLLVLTTVILMVRGRGLSFAPLRAPVLNAPQLLLKRTSTIALVHVFWFALSNHNLNHFLTWLAVLLTYLRVGTEQEDHGWLAITPMRQTAS
jgi:O-Antigen ligase